MRSIPVMVLSLVLFPSHAASQTTAADSRTLQAILEEIHRLRQDLQTTTATVQRAQILLYCVRTQLDVVARVQQRLDEARRESSQAKNQHSHFVAAKKITEDTLERTQDPAVRKEQEEALTAIKDRIEQTAGEESEAEARETALVNQLRLEQEKLDELQGQLDGLDKQLGNSLQHSAGAQ